MKDWRLDPTPPVTRRSIAVVTAIVLAPLAWTVGSWIAAWL